MGSTLYFHYCRICGPLSTNSTLLRPISISSPVHSGVYSFIRYLRPWSFYSTSTLPLTLHVIPSQVLPPTFVPFRIRFLRRIVTSSGLPQFLSSEFDDVKTPIKITLTKFIKILRSSFWTLNKSNGSTVLVEDNDFPSVPLFFSFNLYCFQYN